jgi:ribonuclease T1
VPGFGAAREVLILTSWPTVRRVVGMIALSVFGRGLATMSRSLRLLGRLLLIVALAFGASACAREEQPPAGRAATVPIGEVALDALPREVKQTLALIRQGGPFPYRKDGSVFGNRERLLPKQQRGYYTEYTVPTPGSRDRGARRIVAGKGATGDPATGGEYYYSDDHYQSFRRIRP